ncbi:hypothetical protein CPC16_011599 [Podila verticillata]|nr:hypothetical protein CPC16_011599 [Podila verticillata]KAI9241527.1 MAG: hypothetical protein BYD32DRAFT_433111 [Podila humilis]
MKINRRHFVGILYDCILFEYASLVQDSHGQHSQQYILSLDDLADSFAFVADFYKHHRSLMDIPCDQFITRNQLHTVAGLIDYIEEMDRGVFEIFPLPVELREDAPSFASSSSVRRERRRQERSGYQMGTSGLLSNGPSISASRGKGMNTSSTFQTQPWTDMYSHRGHALHPDTDTDLDDEYSIVIPGLSKTDIQSFLWEYAYMPEDYHDDIATLIRYLRRDEWLMNGSKGPIISFNWSLEGVQKFSREYNQNKIHKVQQREQEEVKRQRELTQKQQEEWNRQQELIREQEAQQRTKITDTFIWKMHESMSILPKASKEIDNLIKTLESEIGEFFDFCFVTLSAMGSFAAELHTNQSDLDLSLGGNVKHITPSSLADALQHYLYENVSISNNPFQQSLSSTLTSRVSFVDPKTAITCHLTLNDPLAIHRSKLIKTYNLIEPRFGPVLVALKHLVVHRHIDTYHFIPFSTYALELMLITFLQTENPPILPKLQQPTPHEDGDEERPLKELIVQGIDCSFDRDWAYYQGFGNRNTKTVAELVLDFCRFFGYVFDYESKEVNARIGAFRWRPDLTRTHTSLAMTSSGPTAGPSTGSSTSTATAIPGFLSRSNSSSSVTTQGSMSRLESVSYAGLVFHVMDPFMVSLNITAPCQGERVRMMKECFQEAYEALNEGDINLAFAHSSH